MQDLQELIQIVTPIKLRSIELLESNSDNPSKMRTLYEGILDKKFTTDKEAAAYFYDKDETYSTYQSLRNNLKNRLINTIFFVNDKEPSYTERQRAYYECNREWAATKILIANNARISGIALCHKILKIAKKYEFSELVLDISRMLRLHYGTREGNLKKFEQFNQLFKEYEEIWKEENIAEELYSQLIVEYVNNKEQNQATAEKAARFYESILPALEMHQSYRLQLCATLIRMIQYNSVGNHAKTIKICEDGIALFEKKDYRADTPFQVFLHQILVCHLQLKEFEEGKKAARRCLEFSIEGYFNWFKYQELFFLLSMHTQEYKQAYSILSHVINHNRFSFLPDVIKETWRIFEAYIHYLVKIGKIELSPEEEETAYSKFRVGKFLNDTPIFSKDRRGMNIPILVIHILFMVLYNRYDDAIDRIEAIEKYCSRYLIKGDTFRSNCFIKMLLQMPISSFHKAGTKRRAKKYSKRLAEYPLDMTNQSHEIEIIPYEDLWEFALSSLDTGFHETTA